ALNNLKQLALDVDNSHSTYAGVPGGAGESALPRDPESTAVHLRDADELAQEARDKALGGLEGLTPEKLNALGYYPPTRALVVKGTSRVHTGLDGGLLTPQGDANETKPGAQISSLHDREKETNKPATEGEVKEGKAREITRLQKDGRPEGEAPP